jgi:hypothetical protein
MFWMKLLPSSADHINVMFPHVQVKKSGHLGLLGPEDGGTAFL